MLQEKDAALDCSKIFQQRNLKLEQEVLTKRQLHNRKNQRQISNLHHKVIYLLYKNHPQVYIQRLVSKLIQLLSFWSHHQAHPAKDPNTYQNLIHQIKNLQTINPLLTTGNNLSRQVLMDFFCFRKSFKKRIRCLGVLQWLIYLSRFKKKSIFFKNKEWILRRRIIIAYLKDKSPLWWTWPPAVNQSHLLTQSQSNLGWLQNLQVKMLKLLLRIIRLLLHLAITSNPLFMEYIHSKETM